MPSKRVPKSRESVIRFEQIPNVGPRIADDFRRLRIDHPHHLVGRDPYALYDKLNVLTGTRQDHAQIHATCLRPARSTSSTGPRSGCSGWRRKRRG